MDKVWGRLWGPSEAERREQHVQSVRRQIQRLEALSEEYNGRAQRAEREVEASKAKLRTLRPKTTAYETEMGRCTTLLARQRSALQEWTHMQAQITKLEGSIGLLGNTTVTESTTDLIERGSALARGAVVDPGRVRKAVDAHDDVEQDMADVQREIATAFGGSVEAPDLRIEIEAELAGERDAPEAEWALPAFLAPPTGEVRLGAGSGAAPAVRLVTDPQEARRLGSKYDL